MLKYEEMTDNVKKSVIYNISNELYNDGIFDAPYTFDNLITKMSRATLKISFGYAFLL